MSCCFHHCQMAVSWKTALSKKAKNASLFIKDVEDVLQHFKNLMPKVQDFTYDHGKETQLFVLDGTIPVNFRGGNYNIPVCVLLQEDHPYVPPMVYIRPTKSMMIKPSPYVNTSGKVFHPYLHQWNYKSSDIASLLQILCGVFSESPPVFSKDPQPVNSERRVSQQNEAAYATCNPTTLTPSQDSQTDCIVCMDKTRDSVLLPCGHLGVCIDCGNSLITTTRTCPICRQRIVKVQRVYQP